jgi:hypothetical protein
MTPLLRRAFYLVPGPDEIPQLGSDREGLGGVRRPTSRPKDVARGTKHDLRLEMATGITALKAGTV